jgi:mono/diheme cytochrome c family protein
MSVHLLKSLTAVVFLILALTSAFSMLTLMGKTEKKISPERLRKIHRIAGYLYAIVLLGLAALGMSIYVRSGDSLSTRAVIHAFIGLFLLSIFFLKWLVARFFRQFLRLMPALGLTVFIISLVNFWMAGYFFLRAAVHKPVPGDPAPAAAAVSTGSAENGAAIFAGLCASCHYPDKEDQKLGPGLKDLFKNGRLPYSGKPVTEEHIRHQLIRPAMSMPAFPQLTEQEIADLMAYLKSL